MNGFEIYTQAWSLPWRRDRTLKSIICRYLHDLDTNRYIDRIEKLVSIINNRLNRIAKLAPLCFSKRCSLLSISLQSSATTATKVQSRRPSWRSKETFHRGYRGKLHWRTFHNFKLTYKKSANMRCRGRERRTHSRYILWDWIDQVFLSHINNSHLISHEFEQFFLINSHESEGYFLLSNACMETFPRNNLYSFTTFLPTPWLSLALETGRWLCRKFRGRQWFAMWLRV